MERVSRSPVMKKNTYFLKVSVSRVIALILIDIMTVIVSSFAALYLRFEFSFNEIPIDYLNR